MADRDIWECELRNEGFHSPSSPVERRERESQEAVSVFNALNDKHRKHPLWDEIGSRMMGWITLKF